MATPRYAARIRILWFYELMVSTCQHKGKVFKVAFTDRWLVVVTGKKLVDELQRLPDDVVSFVEAAGDVCLHPARTGTASHAALTVR